jgi:hypothetical protein
MWAKLKVPPHSKPPSLFQYTITSKCKCFITSLTPSLSPKGGGKKIITKGFDHFKLGIKVERRVCRRNYSFKVESKATYFASTLF